MGSYEVDYLPLFLSILTDWRVIATTAVILGLWAILRSVGVVFRSRSRLPGPPKGRGKAPKASKAKAKAEESAESLEVEE